MKRRSFLTSTGTSLGAICGCLSTSDEEDQLPDERTHHLYLVNLDDDPQRVQLTVTLQETEEKIIDSIYRIPDRRGAEFREVAKWEETYEVTATLDSGNSKSFLWETEWCTNSEAPTGSRNGSLRIESGAAEFSFATDNCDEIIAGTEVATGPASRFEEEET